ncbi:MAG TPA: MFS transporter, partial [Thermoanaerobaculia bacterium]
MTATPAPGRGRHSKSPSISASGRWVLAASVLGSSMAFIDGSVVSVALPVLQEDFGTTASNAQWTVEAYQLFLASLVLVGGSLADRFGRRKVFTIGTFAFAVASLACGLAPNALSLILARAAQGIGGALLVPSSLALLGAGFTPDQRGRAVGTWAALTGIAGAIGPALGGWLVEAISWRAVFLVNLPIAAAVLWIALAKVKESRNPAVGPLDLVGAALATASFGALVYGL